MTQDANTSILWLAPRSKASEAMAKQFLLREEGGVGPAVTCVFARGARANDALRAALAPSSAVTAIVLASPPAVEKLDADITGRLKEITAPVLMLFGAEDEASPPAFGHDWRRALNKGFQTFVFGAGADMANERPEAVAALTADFFTRGEGFLVKASDGRLYD